MNLQKFLKSLKLNENTISMVLGALVIVVVGILIVNYFKDKGGKTLTGVNTEVTRVKEHVVVKGETLWSIAQDNFGSGYNWVDIKKANNLKTDGIEIGQKLIIPDVAAKQPTATKAAAATATKAVTLSGTGPTSPIATSSYVVVKGDCLWNIAVRAYGDGFKWSAIAKANKLVKPNLIHTGNVLVLPR